MDDRTFDSLARALSDGFSRRKLFGGALGLAGASLLGLVRSRAGAAQIQPVGLGDPCFSTAQCASQGTSYCADNGFEYDGAFNCCLPARGRCQFDEHCCGFAGCFDGVCEDLGFGGVESVYPGGMCSTTTQCQAADPFYYCGDNGFDYDGPTNCCTVEDSQCEVDEHCCDQLICFQGFCKDWRSLPERYR